MTYQDLLKDRVAELTAELAASRQEIGRLTAEVQRLEAFHFQKATEWLAREDENISKVCAALDARDRAEAELAEARRLLAEYKRALQFCAASAGNPDAVEGCRNVIKHAMASLAPAGGKGET